MAEQDVRFIVRGRFVSPEGADLGPAAEQEDEGGEEGTDTRTAEKLREALETAKVEIPSGAKKADLLALAAEHKV